MYFYNPVRNNDILANSGSCIVTYKDGRQNCYKVNSGHECFEIKKKPNVIKIDYWPGTSCDYFQSGFLNRFSPVPRMVISFTEGCEPNTNECTYCIEFPDPDDRTVYLCNECCIAYFQPGIGFFKPKFFHSQLNRK